MNQQVLLYIVIQIINKNLVLNLPEILLLAHAFGL